MKITIDSEDKNIIVDATVLEIKAKFLKHNIQNFPRDLVAVLCPYKDPIEVNKWMVRAGNVWRGRGRDESIIEVFKKALEKLNN